MSHPQRYLITGATAGIGKATALELGRRGMQLSIVGRSVEALVALAAELRSVGAADVSHHIADLSVVGDMHALANTLEKGPDLDGVLLSAGVLEQKRKLTVDGYELNYAVNHLHKFVLLQTLVPRLTSRRARVVVSAPVGRVRGNLDDVHGQKSWSAFQGVTNSQWANDMFALELDRRFGSSGLYTIAWNPGSTRGTNLARSMPAWGKVVFWLAMLGGRSLKDVAHQGAELLTTTPAETLTWINGKAHVERALKDEDPSAVWTLAAKLVAEAPSAMGRG